MNEREAAELVKVDLQLAHDMGFKHIRTMTALPIESIERALPLAEKLDVKIAWEIHAPIPIKPDPTIRGKYRRTSEGPGEAVQETVEFIRKTGTKHVGFVPDFGIFAKGPLLSGLHKLVLSLEKQDAGLAGALRQVLDTAPSCEIADILQENFSDYLTAEQMQSLRLRWAPVAQPEDLVEILPYVFSFHGKSHYLREIPGKPGEYEEPSLMYAEVFRVLKEHNWDGYVCTEFEGQGSERGAVWQVMVDEVEQVRRHHKMMKRLIEDDAY